MTVDRGHLEWLPSTGLTQANVSQDVFVVDDGQVAGSSVNSVRVGTLVALEGSMALVHIGVFSSAALGAATALLSGPGTFTRAAESSYVDGAPGSLAYVAADTAAPEDRGGGVAGLLLFREVENLVTDSEDLEAVSWAAAGGGAIAGGADAAPDAGTDADSAVFGTGANENVRTTSPGGGTTALAPVCASVFLAGATGGEQARLRVENAAGTNATAPEAVLTTAWQRVQIQRDGATSGSSERLLLLNSATVDNSTVRTWGAQYEDDIRYAGPYVRTSGARATRPADVWTYAPGDVGAALLSGPSRVVVAPYWTDALLDNADERWILSFDGAADGVRFRKVSSNLLVEVLQGGAVVAESLPITLTQFAPVTIDWYPAEASVLVSGAAGGNGAGPVGTAWTWGAPSSGVRVGGVFGGANELDGILVGASR